LKCTGEPPAMKRDNGELNLVLWAGLLLLALLLK
jgi:hypothetical protein